MREGNEMSQKRINEKKEGVHMNTDLKKQQRKIMAIFTALAIITILVISVCLLAVRPDSGEAGGNMGSEKLREKVLTSARLFNPELETVEESSEYSTDLEVYYSLIDAGGKNCGAIIVDRSTGEPILFFDASAGSAGRVSADVKVKPEEARAIVEGFLEEHGIDLQHYALEKDPLVPMGMEGPPDNLAPVYGYEFNYRIQVNGIFVDDFEHGRGSCLVALSPEDGSIKTFSLPRDSVSLSDLPYDEVKMGKEEALKIAAGKTKGIELDQGKIPVIQGSDVELRYMVKGNRLVPYWRVAIRYRDASLGDLSLLPEEATYLGGCSYYISAVDGQILMEGDTW
ncbi:MAG: hypothetical protein HPY75_06600 [Actinobacteria bacterium]|nr:hypothetical protein [Actinomycetota bacterium]